MSATALAGLAKVPVDDLRPSAANPRENLGDVDGLALSIRENGLIQPIVAQRVPGRRGYQIVSGHRRWAAAKKLGWANVPVLLRRDLLPDEELVTMLVENGQRAGLDPIEEARAMRVLRGQGHSVADIARRTGFAPATVHKRLLLLDLPADAQQMVTERDLPVGQAEDLARQVRKTKNGAVTTKAKSPNHLTRGHSLAETAKRGCDLAGHPEPGRIGGIACSRCWENTIRADERARAYQEGAA